ncbi:MAG: hypothetical protein KJ927_10965, partial [Candidatus Eisenbacteria bacterium]|nr:hypothetical protein [Candidatus Eisenbacteria bacterium]
MRGEDVRPEPTRPHAPARDPRSPLPVESGFDLLKSPIVVAILVTIAAAGLFGIFFLLYQWYGQAPHRLFKIFFGMILLTVLMTRPRWALVMVVFSMPFVEWLPKSGAPMLNSLNLIMIALLLAALFSAISTRTSVLLPSALKKPILFFLAWAFLAWFHALIVPFSESI